MSQCAETPIFTQEVPDKGAARGHVRFTLKSRAPEDVALVGFCANVTASLLFERMQAQGTNIVMHFTKESGVIDVLARAENDGLDLLWNGKQADPAQLSDIQERIRNKTFFIGKEAKAPVAERLPAEKHPPESPPSVAIPLPAQKEEMSEAEEDHLIKQLHRIP